MRELKMSSCVSLVSETRLIVNKMAYLSLSKFRKDINFYIFLAVFRKIRVEKLTYTIKKKTHIFLL